LKFDVTDWPHKYRCLIFPWLISQFFEGMILAVMILYNIFYFLHFGENLIDRTPPQKKKKLNKAHKIQFLFTIHGITMTKLLKTVLSSIYYLSETCIMSNKWIKV